MPTDPVERLRAALDEAEVDINDMGHVWKFGDQICGAAGLKLIERDRALLAEHAKARSENEGIRWSLVGASRCLALDGEVRRAAAFWLGEDTE